MNTAILLLGGNLGNVAQNFEYATLYIEALVHRVVSKSALYVSEPWGFSAEQNFLNRVLIAETNFQALELLEKLQMIEHIFGRKRSGDGYESRLLDIDILFFNSEIIENDKLQIPHLRLHLRNFTLQPLAELLPNFIHPKLGKTIQELLLLSPDNSVVRRVD